MTVSPTARPLGGTKLSFEELMERELAKGEPGATS